MTEAIFFLLHENKYKIMEKNCPGKRGPRGPEEPIAPPSGLNFEPLGVLMNNVTFLRFMTLETSTVGGSCTLGLVNTVQSSKYRETSDQNGFQREDRDKQIKAGFRRAVGWTNATITGLGGRQRGTCYR